MEVKKINALYDEWMDASDEETRALIASSKATFFVWINQQRVTLTMQGDADVESVLETALCSQCVDLCAIVQALQE